MNLFSDIIRILCDFPFQLIVAANLFACAYPRRTHFWLREIVAFLPIMIAYDLLKGHFGYNILSNPLLDKSIMLIPVACICAGILFCYQCRLTEAIFCSASAHPAQNMVFSIYCILQQSLGFSDGSFAALGISLPLVAAVYFLVYRFFARKLRDMEGYRFEQRRLLVNSVIVMLFVVYLYDLVTDRSAMVLSTFVLGDVLALVMQFSLFYESALERRYAIVEQLLYAEQKKRQQIAENTEIINRKCHDLRHQIDALRRMDDGPERNRYFKEVEDAIMIYESAIKTGNETLDLLLMDKQLYCSEHNIKLSCVADGKLIDWMDTMDLCALFGNALENAIESVSGVPDEGKRVISFRIGGSGGLVSIHFENYVDHDVKLRDGLPVTTKRDQQYHGFGMLSICRIVEKYGGTISVHVEDRLFTLNMLFPLRG